MSDLPLLPGTPGFQLGPGAAATPGGVMGAGTGGPGGPIAARWWFKALMGAGVYGGLALAGWLADPGADERARIAYEGQIRQIMAQAGVPPNYPLEEFEKLALENGMSLPPKPVPGASTHVWSDTDSENESDFDGSRDGDDYDDEDEDSDSDGFYGARPTGHSRVTELDDDEDEAAFGGAPRGRGRNSVQRRAESTGAGPTRGRDTASKPPAGSSSAVAAPPQAPHALPERVQEMLKRAEVAARSRRVQEALELYDAAIVGLEGARGFGPTCLEIALILYQKSQTMIRLGGGNADEARATIEQCVHVFEQNGQAILMDDPLMCEDAYIDALSLLGDSLIKNSEYDRASTAFEKAERYARARYEASLEGHHIYSVSSNRDKCGQEYALIRDSLVQIRFNQKKYAEAAEMAPESLSLTLMFYGDQHPVSLQTMMRHARMYMAGGQVERGDAIFEQLFEGLRTKRVDQQAEHAAYNSSARMMLAARGGLIDAATCALEDCVFTQFYAQTCFDSGRFALAVQLYERAEQILISGMQDTQKEIDSGGEEGWREDLVEMIVAQRKQRLVQLGAQLLDVQVDLACALDACEFDSRDASETPRVVKSNSRTAGDLANIIRTTMRERPEYAAPNPNSRFIRVHDADVERAPGSVQFALAVKLERRAVKGPALLETVHDADPCALNGIGGLPEGSLVELCAVRESSVPRVSAETSGNAESAPDRLEADALAGSATSSEATAQEASETIALEASETTAQEASETTAQEASETTQEASETTAREAGETQEAGEVLGAGESDTSESPPTGELAKASEIELEEQAASEEDEPIAEEKLSERTELASDFQEGSPAGTVDDSVPEEEAATSLEPTNTAAGASVDTKTVVETEKEGTDTSEQQDGTPAEPEILSTERATSRPVCVEHTISSADIAAGPATPFTLTIPGLEGVANEYALQVVVFENASRQRVLSRVPVFAVDR